MLFPFAMFAVVAAFVARHFYAMMKRKEEIKEYADKSGLAYGSNVKSRISFRFCSTQLFRLGDIHHLDSAFEAESGGVRITVFDYGNGYSQEKRSGSFQSVVAVESDSIRLPLFAMFPFKSFSSMRSSIEWEKIQLQSDTVLSSMFDFYAPDVDAVDACLSKEVRDFIRSNPEMYLEATRGALLICYPEKHVPADQLTNQFALGHRVLDLFLEFPVNKESRSTKAQVVSSNC